jgi:uncharacterized protein YukE
MTEQTDTTKDALSRVTREWHDLSPELWDGLSIARKFELVAEMAQAIEDEGHDFVSALDPAKLAVMRDMAGALQACVDQIQQMKGMFDDSDGTIGAALQAAEEALDSYHASAEAESHKPFSPTTMTPRMKG